MKSLFAFALLLGCFSLLSAQDTIPPVEEEDYSQYDNVEFVDASARQFVNPKILGLSPNRLVSIGWDAQLPYDMTSSPRGFFQPDDQFESGGGSEVRQTSGLRIDANIPVISRNSFLWQMGGQFWNTRYQFSDPAGEIQQALSENGLRTFGLNT